MTTRTIPLVGKFDSYADEVVWRKTLDTSWIADETGDADLYGCHSASVMDFYGWDYIVHTMSSGRVVVERFRAYFTDDDGKVWRSAECGNRMCELSDEYSAWLGDDEDEEGGES